MRELIAILFGVIISLDSIGATEVEIDDSFSYLAERTHDYHSFSNSEINQTIFKGINSENDKVRSLTLKAIAGESLYISGGGKSERSISKVAGLKKYLISLALNGIEEFDSKAKYQSVPEWWYSFLPLVVFFPSDPEVEAVILKGYDKIKSAKGDFLSFLAIGKFESSKAKSILYKSLLDSNPIVSQKSAISISKLMSDDGLPYLINALSRRDSALINIVEAISNYGIKAKQYLPELYTFQEDLGNYKGDFQLQGNNRIAAAIKRIEDAESVLKKGELEEK